MSRDKEAGLRRGDRVREIWAFLTIDKSDDNEGIPAFRTPDGMMVPMVAADEDRIKSLRPWAQNVADSSRAIVRLVRFTGMEIVETLEPKMHRDSEDLGGKTFAIKLDQ